jgi:hypothetical protein
MRHERSLCAAAFVMFIQVSSGYLYPTYGAVGGLTPSCLTSLNDIFNNKYLLNSVAPSQDTRPDGMYLTPTRRLGCRLLILEALETLTDDNCPAEDDLKNCFWIAHNDWVTLVNGCQVFKSQVPLPACSDSAGEAAEGVPSCSAVTGGGSANIQGRRRLLQGPANDAGIATWQYSYGESAGLQYDPFAPPGSPSAAPPLAANTAGVTGSDAAALRIANEGAEGAAITGSSTSTAVNTGCFPSFWDGQDFQEWLAGNYTETPRPKDYGGVNVVGLVSILIYTILLCSLAFL